MDNIDNHYIDILDPYYSMKIVWMIHHHIQNLIDYMINDLMYYKLNPNNHNHYPQYEYWNNHKNHIKCYNLYIQKCVMFLRCRFSCFSHECVNRLVFVYIYVIPELYGQYTSNSWQEYENGHKRFSDSVID